VKRRHSRTHSSNKLLHIFGVPLASQCAVSGIKEFSPASKGLRVSLLSVLRVSSLFVLTILFSTAGLPAICSVCESEVALSSAQVQVSASASVLQLPVVAELVFSLPNGSVNLRCRFKPPHSGCSNLAEAWQHLPSQILREVEGI
jgi:hypothetical protein